MTLLQGWVSGQGRGGAGVLGGQWLGFGRSDRVAGWPQAMKLAHTSYISGGPGGALTIWQGGKAIDGRLVALLRMQERHFGPARGYVPEIIGRGSVLLDITRRLGSLRHMLHWAMYLTDHFRP